MYRHTRVACRLAGNAVAGRSTYHLWKRTKVQQSGPQLRAKVSFASENRSWHRRLDQGFWPTCAPLNAIGVLLLSRQASTLRPRVKGFGMWGRRVNGHGSHTSSLFFRRFSLWPRSCNLTADYYVASEGHLACKMQSKKYSILRNLLISYTLLLLLWLPAICSNTVDSRCFADLFCML